VNDTLSGLLTLASLIAVLLLVRRPLGDHLARALTPGEHSRAELALYRLLRVDPHASQSARSYLLAVLSFSVASVALLVGLLMTQHLLPLSRGTSGLDLATAVNTAVSFVTNTNWQSYAGESTLGFTAQMAGLAVQNFLSAAVGIAVAAALVRSFARVGGGVGHFTVDLVRVTFRVLVPLAVLFAVALMLGGTAQNLADRTIDTLTGGQQVLPGGPVASQEAIKLLGTNGGGFFNANSAHPLENPTAWTNWLEVFAMLLIPVALTRTVGTMLDRQRQGWAVLATMGVLYASTLTVLVLSEVGGHSLAARAAGGALEGKENRLGVWGSLLFGSVSTGTSTGAVNSAHDSFTPGGGGALLTNMMLGEVSPGGVGSGIYGILVMAVLAVFVAGQMVGRTPELLGKKIGPRALTWAASYALVTPVLVLVGTGVALALGDARAAVANPGPHGFSEVLYAYTSAANNNGSAFGGITVTSDWFQYSLATAMFVGRLLPIACVLVLAGHLVDLPKAPTTSGTLPTDRPLFVGLWAGVVVVLTGLTYFPALALGPIAEALA